MARARAGVTRGLIALFVAALAASPGPAGAAGPLPDIPFAVAADVLFTETRNDGRQGPRGRWRLEGGRLEAGGIRLRVAIEPQPHGLPVDSGPAVLFGGLSLFGDAGGDMGIGGRVDALSSVTLPPCDDAACRYLAEIVIPTTDLAPAIQRLEQRGRLMWASADLTLVRTFGGGSWLQVLPFYPGGEGGPLDGAAGRLGAIEPIEGTLFPFGLFPAALATPAPGELFVSGEELDYGALVERLRSESGDPTSPIRSARGRLRIGIPPSCEGGARLAMHDGAGDRILDVDSFGIETIDEAIELPVGVPWHLTLHDGGGIDFDQGRQGWGIRLGPVESDGTPIVVDAIFDCDQLTGVVRVTGGTAEPTAAPPAPTAMPSEGPGSPPGGTPFGLLAIIVVGALVALFGIGGRRRRSGP